MLRIVVDDLSGPEIAALLAEHKQDMMDTSPEDAVFTLPIDALREPDVVVWSAWAGDDLAGCGALKELNTNSGEVKSMRTSTSHRGQGVGSAICEHIVNEARSRGYDTLYIETGSHPAFEPAHRLYQKHGFVYRGPFGDYKENDFSRFMELKL